MKSALPGEEQSLKLFGGKRQKAKVYEALAKFIIV
jgi:hypothetical protein